jgi:hypothetical protein
MLFKDVRHFSPARWNKFDLDKKGGRNYWAFLRVMANLIFCYPKRCEGPQLPENARFFAPLRMILII